MRIEPTKHQMQCPQCGNMSAKHCYENGVCWGCVRENNRLNQQAQAQARQAANEARNARVAEGYDNYGRPLDSGRIQPTTGGGSELGPAGQAVGAGCLLAVVLFFLPYVLFSWMFLGGYLNVDAFLNCFDSIWAWIFSIIFWIGLFGFLGSRQ